jgi:hypothetical protein
VSTQKVQILFNSHVFDECQEGGAKELVLRLDSDSIHYVNEIFRDFYAVLEVS